MCERKVRHGRANMLRMPRLDERPPRGKSGRLAASRYARSLPETRRGV